MRLTMHPTVEPARGWLARRKFLMVAGLVIPAAVSMVVAATAEPPRSEALDIFQHNARLGRGVNIIGYDPLWQSRDRARFQDRHFRLIKEAGFNHVRINLHPFRTGKMDKDQKLNEPWLATLDWAVEQATAAGLLVILDCHEFQAMGADPAGHQEAFLAVWRQLAERCKDQSDAVLFEILNEPSQKLTPELWNALLREALTIIRQSNPTRAVIIGPGNWNNIGFLEKLELPQDDRHIIVTVHYYSPFEFTHQGAPWAGKQDKTGIAWNGTDEEQAAIGRDFDKAQAWSRQHERPVYLGEFGAYDKADMDSRVRWTSFVARQAEERGWSWGYWQFDSDFIVFDMRTQQWVQPICDALIPPVKP